MNRNWLWPCPLDMGRLGGDRRTIAAGRAPARSMRRSLSLQPAAPKNSDQLRARNILHGNSRSRPSVKERTQTRSSSTRSVAVSDKHRLAIDKEFDVAIRTPLSMILASPRFLFMKEPGQEGVAPCPGRSRAGSAGCHYFLMEFAARYPAAWSWRRTKRLSRPGNVLRGQVDRLIQDPRAHHFVSGLAHQWLDMKRLDFLPV